MELSGLNVDYASLAVELQTKIASESTLLSAGFPDQTIVLLSNVLAGITAMLNYSQTVANLNNFTQFAFLKSAGYAIAGTLGVSPARKMGAQQTAVFSSGDNNPTFSSQLTVPLTIPAYTRFSCRGLMWHTRQDYTINPTDSAVTLQLFEGTNNSVSFNSTGELFQRYLFGTQYNVDQDTVQVIIDNTYWTEGSGTFVKYTPIDQVFIPMTSPDGRVIILFGNGVYGEIPPVGTKITVRYTTTLGLQGNSVSIGDNVSMIDTVQITQGIGLSLSGITTTIASGGSDEDDLNTIKYVTPRLYASNQRSVRRNDYIGQLLGTECPVSFIDAVCWGEYEQAQLVGLGELNMMNRAYWTAILAGLISKTDNSAGIRDLSSSFDYFLSELSTIPGSLMITNDDLMYGNLVFTDIDGYGVLTCPSVKFDYLTTNGVVVTTNSDVGTTVSSLIDGSPDTAWQSIILPTVSTPVYVMMTLPVAQIPKSFRLRAASDINGLKRAFPNSISVWGSNNPTPPAMTNPLLWTPVRGNVYLDDPGIEGPSRWYALNNQTAYAYIMFQISGSHGNLYTKLSEIEVQISTNSSTIDYSNSNVVLNYGVDIAQGSVLTSQYYVSDLSLNQQTETQAFILNTNHFTTQFTYKSPRMLRTDLTFQIFYNPAYSQNTVLSGVSNSLQTLLEIKEGSLSRSIKFSDISRAITKVKGVDYFIPPITSNYDVEFGQFVYMTSLNITLTQSSR